MKLCPYTFDSAVKIFYTLIPFKIVKNNKINSNENHDERHCNNERSARTVAAEGE